MELAIREILPTLDFTTTSLCLVHAINPWGMKYEQRTNAANVDLNRNFVTNWSPPPPINTGYHSLRAIFQPQGPVPTIPWNRLLVTSQVMRLALTGRSSMLRQALLAGQYEEPTGLYYGGRAWQSETQVMRALYDECLHTAPHLVQLPVPNAWKHRPDDSNVRNVL